MLQGARFCLLESPIRFRVVRTLNQKYWVSISDGPLPYGHRKVAGSGSFLYSTPDSRNCAPTFNSTSGAPQDLEDSRATGDAAVKPSYSMLPALPKALASPM